MFLNFSGLMFLLWVPTCLLQDGSGKIQLVISQEVRLGTGITWFCFPIRTMYLYGICVIRS